ncbi:uncharacterized protein LOC124267824 [Haliotis rubra]|uniref:uncharacterized protein LOC124267824 n=1 Tax=Haliotis rubra TaxID=36100 RepID=UPI001EE52705|nr:uncharacterized protein LOC124267824 [Haliotis rubra]
MSLVLIPGYFHHSAFYPILVFLLMDGSVADRSMSCTKLSSPATETTVLRGGGCFLLSRVARTWEESETFCKDLGDGWSLVVIEDAETQTRVDNLTLTAGVSSQSWIGLHRQENKYKWVSGIDLGFPTFFRELGEGEVSPPGDCVTTSPPGDTIYGTWSNAECTTRLFTICHTNTILIPVTSGVAVVAAVAVVGVVIILCRRNKAKRLRVRTIDTDAGDDRESGDVSTKPTVVYAVVTPGRKRETSQAPSYDADPGYHYIPVDGEDSAGQGVTDPMYDTATAPQGKQQVTLDNTYDRAMFRQSGDGVYDHTSLTRKSPQVHDTSHYDHAIVQ